MKRALFGVILVVLAAVTAAGCGSTYSAGPRAMYDAEPELAMGAIAQEESVGRTYELQHAVTKNLEDVRGVAAVPFTLGKGGWENEISEVGTPEELAGRERLLVYSGSFTVAVGNIEDAQTNAREMAESLGGYFQSLKKDTITLRVPATKWEEAVAAVSDLGRVLDRAIDASDVTEEVVDLRLRLRNAQKLMSRLEELLARAENVEAALKVEKELARVREEVERIEGRLQWLGDRIAYSTLVIAFVQAREAAARPQALPFPWLSDLSLENLLGLPGGVR